MRQHRLLILLLSALLLLSACGGTGPAAEPPPEEEPDISQGDPAPAPLPFTLAIYPEYSIHPVLGANRANLTLAPLLYEPLFQVDSSFQARPVLCQSWTASEDKLTWTLTLRSGITFSDGTPLTGETVAAALELARGENSRFAKRLETVTDVTGEGEEVTLTLSRPNASLPLLLDIPITLGEGERPAGTGPYVLQGAEENLTLSARAGWWQRKSLPAQTIRLRPVSKSDEMVLAFDSGDVSLVDVDLMGTNALGYLGNYEIWDYPTTDLIYLGFNTQTGVCRTPQVRQALALALDREAIVQVPYASHAVPAALPFHPASALYDQTLADRLAYNPEEMASRLESRRVLGRELTLIVNGENPAKVSAAQLIAYQLESAGMQVTLRELTFEDFTAALSRGDFDLYLGEVVLPADFSLFALLSPGGELNYGGWTFWECYTLLLELAQAEEADRPQAAAALCEFLLEEVPIAPICFKNGSVLAQWGRLSGLNPVRENVFYELENWSVQ